MAVFPIAGVRSASRICIFTSYLKFQQKCTLVFEGGNYPVKLPKMKSQKE